MSASSNMHQICLSAHNYNDSNGKLPGPFVDKVEYGPPVTPPSDPSKRLSWRVAMLPYLEQDNLYKRLDLNQAWDSATNQPVSSTAIKTFGDPMDPADTNTRYRCFYDNGALWDSDPAKRISISNIPDGSSNTILFVETTDRVPWAQFNELKFDPNGGPPALGHDKRDVFLVGMADSSVRFVKKTVDPAVLKAAITRAGGEKVNLDE